MKFHCLIHPNVIFTFSSRFDKIGNKSDGSYVHQYIGGILFKPVKSNAYFIEKSPMTLISAGRVGASLKESFQCRMCSLGYEGTYANQVKFVNYLHNNMRET